MFRKLAPLIMPMLACILFSIPISAEPVKIDQTQIINVDAGGGGRTFEGIGALSAGASSRLLIDYPGPQRSQILDFLFKPNFGAALHHLKVEIGGDTNSTDGSEPSIAHTREEFDHPRPEYFNRGYEWWLMREAKARNPRVLLDGLQWGAPGWIGDGKFFTDDNAEFIAAFIAGARDYQGLKMDFQGIWNEFPYEAAWIKTLRRTLDKHGLSDVKIVAADQVNYWGMVQDIHDDPDLGQAVYSIGVHYPGGSSPQSAKDLDKPLWASEDGPWRGDWEGACSLARIYNRNYIVGRMTKTIVWSPITCYYDNLPIPGSGLMKANTPWSGSYEVRPAVWATAHTTQFTQPGWKYIDSGCGFLSLGGSFVTLKNPATGDYSIVIETMDTPYGNWIDRRYVEFHLSGRLSLGPVHVWKSDEKSQFVQLPDIQPVGNIVPVTLDGRSIYTLTTTTGQQKGSAPIPPASAFPFPYRDDFERYPVPRMPKYLSDQCGSFEVVKRADGRGKCLRQLSPKKNIEWVVKMEHPWTYLGSPDWSDYEVTSDVLIEKSGSAAIYGRISSVTNAPQGYGLKVDESGNWEVQESSETLDKGKVALSPGTWHNLRLAFTGPSISAYIDGVRVTSIYDTSHSKGMAGLGCGWNLAQFDNFAVQPTTGPKPKIDSCWLNLAQGKKTTSSSDWSSEYDAAKANDGDASTRWNSAEGKTVGEWLQIDFGKETTFDRTIIHQFTDRITGYKIQYWDGKDWRDAYTGGVMGLARKIDDFAPVKSSKIRLLITATRNQTPTIYEFQVFRHGR